VILDTILVVPAARPMPPMDGMGGGMNPPMGAQPPKQ
jgi:hypothetical protein